MTRSHKRDSVLECWGNHVYGKFEGTRKMVLKSSKRINRPRGGFPKYLRHTHMGMSGSTTPKVESQKMTPPPSRSLESPLELDRSKPGLRPPDPTEHWIGNRVPGHAHHFTGLERLTTQLVPRCRPFAGQLQQGPRIRGKRADRAASGGSLTNIRETQPL